MNNELRALSRFKRTTNVKLVGLNEEQHEKKALRLLSQARRFRRLKLDIRLFKNSKISCKLPRKALRLLSRIKEIHFNLTFDSCSIYHMLNDLKILRLVKKMKLRLRNPSLITIRDGLGIFVPKHSRALFPRLQEQLLISLDLLDIKEREIVEVNKSFFLLEGIKVLKRLAATTVALRVSININFHISYYLDSLPELQTLIKDLSALVSLEITSESITKVQDKRAISHKSSCRGMRNSVTFVELIPAMSSLESIKVNFQQDIDRSDFNQFFKQIRLLPNLINLFLNLDGISVQHTTISTLSEHLLYLKGLKSLTIMFGEPWVSKFILETMERFAQSLTNLRGLTKLHLKMPQNRVYRSSQESEKIYGKVLYAITYLQNLKELSLELRDGDTAIEHIITGLLLLKNLEIISLNLQSLKSTTKDKIRGFIESLSQMSFLRSLDIHARDVDVDLEFLLQLDGVFDRLSRLEYLDLYLQASYMVGNSKEIESSKVMMKTLIEKLQKRMFVKRVRIIRI